MVLLPLGQALAQSTEASVDLGGVALRYADSVNATAAALTPRVRFDSRQMSSDIEGTFSQFAGGGWSSQGSAQTSLFSVPRNRLMFELAGFAGGSYHHDATKTGEALLNARLHFSGNRTGAFTGGGIGSTWNVDGWRRLLIGEAGVWARSDLGSAIASLSPVSVNDTTRYVDSQLSLAAARARFDVSALAGFRFGSHLPTDLTGAKSWASFAATAWVTERVGVVAAGGTYPVDPTQGFPGGRFVSLSIRLASARRNAASLQNVSVQSATDSDVAPDVDAFRAVRTATGQISFRVHAPAANSVEINGDFTQWAPANLTRSGQGWWTLTLPVSAGTYQMNLRVDGGPWLVPAGLLSIKDEFGGVVGVLVIE